MEERIRKKCRISGLKLFNILLVLLIISGCKDSDKIKNIKLNKEYPHVARDSTLLGIIDSMFVFDMSIPKGALYLNLTDGRKFVAIRNAYPRNFFGADNISNFSLEDFLEKGDTIYKPAGRDSLYVLKNGLKYAYFLSTKEFSDSVFQRR